MALPLTEMPLLTPEAVLALETSPQSASRPTQLPLPRTSPTTPGGALEERSSGPALTPESPPLPPQCHRRRQVMVSHERSPRKIAACATRPWRPRWTFSAAALTDSTCRATRPSTSERRQTDVARHTERLQQSKKPTEEHSNNAAKRLWQRRSRSHDERKRRVIHQSHTEREERASDMRHSHGLVEETAFVHVSCSCDVHRICIRGFVEDATPRGRAYGADTITHQVTCPSPALHAVHQEVELQPLLQQIRGLGRSTDRRREP